MSHGGAEGGDVIVSYRVVELYAVRCDGVIRPGTADEWPCDAEPSDDLIWDEDTADEDAVTSGWQVFLDETGRTHHYCPLHIHAMCAQCGRREIGGIDELKQHGWRDAKYYFALCPQCAAVM